MLRLSNRNKVNGGYSVWITVYWMRLKTRRFFNKLLFADFETEGTMIRQNWINVCVAFWYQTVDVNSVCSCGWLYGGEPGLYGGRAQLNDAIILVATLFACTTFCNSTLVADLFLSDENLNIVS